MSYPTEFNSYKIPIKNRNLSQIEFEYINKHFKEKTIEEWAKDFNMNVGYFKNKYFTRKLGNLDKSNKEKNNFIKLEIGSTYKFEKSETKKTLKTYYSVTGKVVEEYQYFYLIDTGKSKTTMHKCNCSELSITKIK